MATVVSRDGTALAFDRLGDGSPIILVHPAFSHRSFNPAMAELAQRLASRFTVFNYDRRGRGDSGDTPPYSVEREIEDLEAILAEAGGAAYVYAMSSGAALALAAVSRGVPVAKLALYEPPFFVDDTHPPVPADYASRLADLVASGRRDEALEYYFTRVALVPADMVAQMRTQPMWPAFQAVAHTLYYDARIMEGTQQGKPLPAERTASVTVPTLLIVGSAAPVWTHHAVQALAKALPNAHVQTLEGEFHAVAPATLAPALAEFFSA
jgi:pimeloyl-ACP methyl ester carboxylesterase